MSNGNTLYWNEDSIYIQFIVKLNRIQLTIAVLCFKNQDISSELKFNLCKKSIRN